MHRRLAIILTTWLLAVVPGHGQWTEPVRISEPGGCHYPQILAEGNSLHVVYSNNEGGTKISYVRSSDGGITWNEYSVLSDTVNTNDTQFPRIMKYGSKLIVIWRAYFIQGVNRLNIGFSISTNNGLSWSEPNYILNPNWDHILNLSASGSGAIVNVMINSNINHQLKYFNIRSTNFGQSWSQPIEIFSVYQASRADQISFGEYVHYCWSGQFATDATFECYYIMSTDGGVSWDDNVLISEDDDIISEAPAICTDESGNVAMTWWDFKYSPYGFTGDVLIRQSFDGGITWEQRIKLLRSIRL